MSYLFSACGRIRVWLAGIGVRVSSVGLFRIHPGNNSAAFFGEQAPRFSENFSRGEPRHRVMLWSGFLHLPRYFGTDKPVSHGETQQTDAYFPDAIREEHSRLHVQSGLRGNEGRQQR